MSNLDEIVESVRADFEARNTAREEALRISRSLVRLSANSIRAIHRREWDNARTQLDETRQVALQLLAATAAYPDLFFSGYTQDALREYVEAFLTFALVRNEPLLSPQALQVPPATWIGGLAEASTELRRHILDIIRPGHATEAEQLLESMDAVYSHLITLDFPDAITDGLRRRTDAVRGVLERTRGDLTTSLRQQLLQDALETLGQKIVLKETPTDES